MKRLYDEKQIKQSIDFLNTVLPDQDVKNGSLFQIFCNTKIVQDFSGKSLKRINVKSSSFLHCNFKATAATGSNFADTEFRDCKFVGSAFQYCYFRNVIFDDATFLSGANFSHSIFIQCKFLQVAIKQSTLFDCYFENCTFIGSNIDTVTLENSSMHNCILEDIDLSRINMEYMIFDNLHSKNIILPPYQIAYVIGGPSYLQNTKDKILLYTDVGTIPKTQYCKLYNDLAAYYYSHKEFFPLANIYIAENKHELAYECIRLGIRDASAYSDFRMIKHYCKLASSNEQFSHVQLKELYDDITNISYDNKWDLNTLHSYQINIGEIREILLNNFVHSQKVEFCIKTNINKQDISSVNELYAQVNQIIRESCTSSHIDAIEIRHNSPYELYVMCIDALPNLVLLISSLYGFLSAANKFVDLYKNFEETRRIHQQNQFYQYEKEEKLLDIELKKNELAQKKKSVEVKSSSILTIREIEHNMRCNTLDSAKNITPEYLHYKFTANIQEQ